jgi:hypothetical protein
MGFLKYYTFGKYKFYLAKVSGVTYALMYTVQGLSKYLSMNHLLNVEILNIERQSIENYPT